MGSIGFLLSLLLMTLLAKSNVYLPTNFQLCFTIITKDTNASMMKPEVRFEIMSNIPNSEMELMGDNHSQSLG